MKTRALPGIVLGVTLAAMLVITGVYAAPVGPASFPEARAALANPVIRLSPSSRTVLPGAVFALDVVVDNVVDLGAFEFTLVFDPAVVNVKSVSLGPFLASTGRSVGMAEPAIDNSAGSLAFAGFSYGTVAGPSGTGTVAQVTLQAMAVGSSSLTFTQAQLTDTQWNPPGVVIPTMNPGMVTVSARKLGDVNADGLANSTDALIVLSCDAGFNTSAFCPMNCGDVNADGYVNSTDALIILSYDAAMPVPFPVGQPGCPATITPCPGCNP